MYEYEVMVDMFVDRGMTAWERCTDGEIQGEIISTICVRCVDLDPEN